MKSKSDRSFKFGDGKVVNAYGDKKELLSVEL